MLVLPASVHHNENAYAFQKASDIGRVRIRGECPGVGPGTGRAEAPVERVGAAHRAQKGGIHAAGWHAGGGTGDRRRGGRPADESDEIVQPESAPQGEATGAAPR